MEPIRVTKGSSSSKKYVFLFGALINAMVGAHTAIAQTEAPDPLAVGLTEFVANGSGCPGGIDSNRITLTDNADALLIDFGLMSAIAGGNHPIADSRKVCTVGMKINAPTGWTYRIAEAGFQYGVRIAEGETANIKIETWIQGAGTDNDSAQLALPGPLAGSAGGHMEFINSPFAPCNESRLVNFKNALWVPLTSQFSRVRFQSPVAYRIEWKRCE